MSVIFYRITYIRNIVIRIHLYSGPLCLCWGWRAKFCRSLWALNSVSPTGHEPAFSAAPLCHAPYPRPRISCQTHPEPCRQFLSLSLTSFLLTPSSFSHPVTEAYFQWTLYLCCIPNESSCRSAAVVGHRRWFRIDGTVLPVWSRCACMCGVFVCTLTFELLFAPELFHDITALSQLFLPLAQLLHIWTSPDL